MFLNGPVRIPDVPGKIVFRKKGDSRYVLLETGRRYDKWRKYNLVERRTIGIQIPEKPEYMLPNENYFMLFPGGKRRHREEKQGGATQDLWH